MSEIRFYHLTRDRLEDVLPNLLEKTLERGWRAVVMAGSAERAEALTQHLWTYHPSRFLPHGTARDGFAADQPIWLTAVDERPNDAAVLFLTDGAQSQRYSDFERVCEIFDGADADALHAARSRWSVYKKDGHSLSYWQQEGSSWANRTPS